MLAGYHRGGLDYDVLRDIARITEVIRQITPEYKQPLAPPASDRG